MILMLSSFSEQLRLQHLFSYFWFLKLGVYCLCFTIFLSARGGAKRWFTPATPFSVTSRWTTAPLAKLKSHHHYQSWSLGLTIAAKAHGQFIIQEPRPDRNGHDTRNGVMGAVCVCVCVGGGWLVGWGCGGWVGGGVRLVVLRWWVGGRAVG